jgi:hypothetical protein
MVGHNNEIQHTPDDDDDDSDLDDDKEIVQDREVDQVPSMFFSTLIISIRLC